ncbi:MAG: isoprenylcysteine carboxylmethyltransferase family protein [Acidobacteriota bacterium]
MKLNYLTLVLAVLACVLVIAHFWGLPWDGMRVTGLAVMLAAFLMLVVARVQLGSSFSVKAKATHLVTTGLYSRIRNPIYVAGIFILIGLALWVRKPWFLLALIALVPMQIARSRKEARVLEERFGAEYVEYRRKTWM